MIHRRREYSRHQDNIQCSSRVFQNVEKYGVNSCAMTVNLLVKIRHQPRPSARPRPLRWCGSASGCVLTRQKLIARSEVAMNGTPRPAVSTPPAAERLRRPCPERRPQTEWRSKWANARLATKGEARYRYGGAPPKTPQASVFLHALLVVEPANFKTPIICRPTG